MPARGVFIAGTDTGIGKTLIACALLRGMAGAGLRVVGMKPVAAGATRRKGVLINEDVEQLRAASNVVAPLCTMNPYCFVPPVAPHLAAREAGTLIRMSVLSRHYALLAARADVVVVEGVGGLLVPLGPRLSAADIPQRLNLPVLLVVGMRLGCLNHALLTLEAVRMRGLRLAGWIANAIDPSMTRRKENLEALQQRIDAPLLGIVKHVAEPDPARVAQSLDISRINEVI
ncbi:MAG: ATP-dependent dethiobiotin synthetase [Pseudomonadota bacterium]|jgi:dethiobiotin synthetase